MEHTTNPTTPVKARGPGHALATSAEAAQQAYLEQPAEVLIPTPHPGSGAAYLEQPADVLVPTPYPGVSMLHQSPGGWADENAAHLGPFLVTSPECWETDSGPVATPVSCPEDGGQAWNSSSPADSSHAWNSSSPADSGPSQKDASPDLSGTSAWSRRSSTDFELGRFSDENHRHFTGMETLYEGARQAGLSPRTAWETLNPTVVKTTVWGKKAAPQHDAPPETTASTVAAPSTPRYCSSTSSISSATDSAASSNYAPASAPPAAPPPSARKRKAEMAP